MDQAVETGSPGPARVRRSYRGREVWLADSAHLRGSGEFVGGIEQSRMAVTLAPGLSRQVRRVHGLGYRNPNPADPQAWLGEVSTAGADLV